MKFTFQPESRPLLGYTLKRGIARGGFGEVYYALSDAGKEVAVKLLQHNLDIELRGVQQCLNLRHPNLVAIFDVKTDADSDHWVVMEYIAGQTLEQALQAQKGPMPVDHIERWLVGLAGGLGYLHDRGIVHRDVKPGNIFWDQGSVKLGDVGLSKFMTPSRRSAHTESVGTVYYMAPEVTYGKYGYEVDIYSVGVMLYEMLSGQLPFDGQSTGEILMKHLSEPPNLSIISAQFRPLLAAALEKDPKKRTGSMGKLLSDFRQAKSGGPIPVAATRQSGFAAYPSAQAGAQSPAPGTPVEAPQVAAATQALQVGTIATNFGKVWGADPVAVQSSINYLPKAAMILAKGLGIGYLILIIAIVCWPLLPVGAVALLVSPALRQKVRYHWVRLVMGDEQAKIPPARPKTVAQVAAPVGVSRPPSPLPGAVPIRQVVSPSNAQPTPTSPCRVDRMTLRLADLSGSLSWATVLAMVFAAGTGFLSPLFGSAASLHPDLGKLGLFTLTTLIAVWTILVVSTLTAGNRVSNHHRRLVHLVAGAAVGSIAWWLSTVLMVDMSVGNLNHQAIFDSIGRQPLALNSRPTWLGFAIFFGLLFAARRWWWHADPNRPAMFRITSVIRTIVVAAILPMICVFPWDWAVTWAAVMSCVVQLSAAWVPEDLRDRLPRRDHRGAA